MSGDAAVTLPRDVVERLVRLAGLAATEHLYTESKISERCIYEDGDCSRPDHPNCGIWGASHSATCHACEPIKAAREALNVT